MAGEAIFGVETFQGGVSTVENFEFIKFSISFFNWFSCWPYSRGSEVVFISENNLLIKPLRPKSSMRIDSNFADVEAESILFLESSKILLRSIFIFGRNVPLARFYSDFNKKPASSAGFNLLNDNISHLILGK